MEIKKLNVLKYWKKSGFFLISRKKKLCETYKRDSEHLSAMLWMVSPSINFLSLHEWLSHPLGVKAYNNELYFPIFHFTAEIYLPLNSVII